MYLSELGKLPGPYAKPVNKQEGSKIKEISSAIPHILSLIKKYFGVLKVLLTRPLIINYLGVMYSLIFIFRPEITE